MKNKKIIRLFTAALAVALCATAFAVPAFAGGGEGEPYYTETEADLTEDDEAPEVTITDEEDPAGDDSADNNREADGDTLDQITELLGGLGTVTVTEDGIRPPRHHPHAGAGESRPVRTDCGRTEHPAAGVPGAAVCGGGTLCV